VAHRSDKALVKRILKGDREACGQLVRSHYAPIYQLLANLCRNAHLAEDLTQETFAAAWANLGTFSGSSSLMTWLHRIAYHKFIDACRRKDRNQAGDSEGKIDWVESKKSDPLDEALANDEAARLHRAIERLKPAEKSVIVLHYLQGLSFREVAEVMGEPPGTIRWRSGLALENLKIALNGKEEYGIQSTIIS
jgi:RNA polymerase sigma-70 factor (ECF subfamily)